jgi:two-component system LytT family response regulator
MQAPLTALIADDEPLARAHLRRQLDAHQVKVIGEAGDAAETLRLTEELKPDLLFLDIRMPGISGLDLASALPHLEKPPLVVFVTGYSEHAVGAFERDALDYLLKPISADRLLLTLSRARARLADRRARRKTEQEAETDEAVTAVRAARSPLRRLPVRGDYAVRLIRVSDIVCIVARDKRVYVQTAEGEHRAYYTLTQLESLLPPDSFLRIHDSCIANLDLAEEILLLGNHSYELRLTDKRLLPVGRSRYPELQKRLGILSSA